MKKIYFFLLLFGPLLFAQQQGSPVAVPGAETDSEIDFITALAGVDTTLTEDEIHRFRESIREFVSTVPEKEEKDRREVKRIKKIYGEAHEKFFRKYKDVAFFPELVKDGVYNCVTATALYAEIFEKLDIPFEVKEAPAHVYLIAYPNSLKIYLETTVPGRYGFFSISESQRRRAVDEMVEMKLLTSEEVREKGYSKVYQDYVFGTKVLEKNALIGMHYFNSALFKYEEKEYQTALEHINSSMKFYDSEVSLPLKKELLGRTLEEMDFDNQQEVDHLFRVFEGMKFQKDYVGDELKSYLHKIIIHDNNDVDFIEEAATKFSGLSDSIAANVSKQFFYSYIAEEHIDRRNFKEAIRTADTLLSLNADNKLAKDILISAVPARVYYISNENEALELLDNYIEQYPFLLADKASVSLKALLLMKLAYNNYERRKENAAENYLNSLEQQVEKYDGLVQIDPQARKTLYLTAGRYYYGQKRYGEALARFQKGLSYNPTDPELGKMARWVKEDMNKKY
ncbi:MAG TPA: hypothetical protein ENO10_02005 [Salinimicrobium catena]|uniref:Uncharacterized protein n=1 Tax=Salinimicrobium catena TaxID=390640 RepID=A0A7C2R390_9FLAO|nr:hypothetical protein [Salinimicrobium catena]